MCDSWKVCREVARARADRWPGVGAGCLARVAANQVTERFRIEGWLKHFKITYFKKHMHIPPTLEMLRLSVVSDIAEPIGHQSYRMQSWKKNAITSITDCRTFLKSQKHIAKQCTQFCLILCFVAFHSLLLRNLQLDYNKLFSQICNFSWNIACFRELLASWTVLE